MERSPSSYAHLKPPGGAEVCVPAWLDRLVEVGPRRPLRGLVGHALVLACLTGVFVVCVSLRPAPDYVGTHEQFGLPPCSFRAVFGLPCPGCGGTTAVVYLAHLRLLDALRSSVFGAVVGLAMAVAWVLCLASLVLRRPLHPRLEGQAGARVMGYTVVLMLLSWAIKIIYTLVALPGVPR